MKNSKAQNEEKEYPGYPHYPNSEDITNEDNNNGKADINEQGTIELSDAKDNPNTDEDDEVKIVMGTEADVTKEDLRILNGDSMTSELDEFDEDGEPLNEDIDTTLNPGEGLDVPGSEEDDANEDIGEEDEENNYYSLGGDKEETQDAE